jgi:hypothetical protein
LATIGAVRLVPPTHATSPSAKVPQQASITELTDSLCVALRNDTLIHLIPNYAIPLFQRMV